MQASDAADAYEIRDLFSATTSCILYNWGTLLRHQS